MSGPIENPVALTEQLLSVAGVPHVLEGGRARFELRTPQDVVLPGSAEIRVREMRLTAHDAVTGRQALMPPLWWLPQINFGWAFGRGYRVPGRHDAIDVTASMYLGSGLPGGDDVNTVLARLGAAADLMRRGALPVWEPHPGDGSGVLRQVAGHLTGFGLTPRPWEGAQPEGAQPEGAQPEGAQPEGALFVVVSSGPAVRARLKFDTTGTSLRVIADAIVGLPSVGQDDPVLDELNAGLSFGSVGTFEDGAPYYLIFEPLEWTTVDPAPVHWIVSKSLFVLGELNRRLTSAA